MCWRSFRALRIALLKFHFFSSCGACAVNFSGFVDGLGGFRVFFSCVFFFFVVAVVIVSVLQEFHIFNHHLI